MERSNLKVFKYKEERRREYLQQRSPFAKEVNEIVEKLREYHLTKLWLRWELARLCHINVSPTTLSKILSGKYVHRLDEKVVPNALAIVNRYEDKYFFSY